MYTSGLSGNVKIEGDLLPSTDGIYNIGALGQRWKEIFIGSGTINIAGPSGSTAVGLIGTDDSSIVYTQFGFASPFINIGPSIDSNLSSGSIGGWVVGPTGILGTNNYDLIAQQGLTGIAFPDGLTGVKYSLIKNIQPETIIAGGTAGISGQVLISTESGIAWNSLEFPTATCASAYSTASQSIAANVSENLQHDVVGFAYGINVTTGTTGYFQVPSAGVYKIIPSLQLNPTSNGNIHVWIKVNGTNVPNTATYLTFKNGEKQVFTTEILLELNTNDQVQIWTQASVSGGVVEYIVGGGTSPNDYPAAPGIITNMYKLR
jgi:hypothetical protein